MKGKFNQKDRGEKNIISKELSNWRISLIKKVAEAHHSQCVATQRERKFVYGHA